MVEIPMNENQMSEEDKLTTKIVEYLKDHDTYQSYRYSDGVPLSLAQTMCRNFSQKGYHGKIVYFCDGRASYQSFTISKHHLDETRARMVYSQVY